MQIAGLVARRILCELKPQQGVRAGERFGLIRFGSRIDVYLPAGVAPLVAVGPAHGGGRNRARRSRLDRSRATRGTSTEMVVPPPFASSAPAAARYPSTGCCPNILTLLALCAGLTGDPFRLAGPLPGRGDRDHHRRHSRRRSTAGWRGGWAAPAGSAPSSNSLSDFISFGVAPAMLIYLWTMNGAGSIGWALVLLFPVCSALAPGALQHRAERRHQAAGLDGRLLHRRAGAGRRPALVLLPMMLSFETGAWGADFFGHPCWSAWSWPPSAR